MRRLGKAILYFHGGGFRLGSVSSHRDLIAQNIARRAAAACSRSTTGSRPEHRFPAPLDDAIAAYGWMLRSGIEAGEYRLCRGFRRRKSRARSDADLARTRSAAAGGGGADVAMDRSGCDRRELCQPCRRRSDPPAADDPGAGEELSRAGRRSRAIRWCRRSMPTSPVCRRC